MSARHGKLESGILRGAMNRDLDVRASRDVLLFVAYLPGLDKDYFFSVHSDVRV